MHRLVAVATGTTIGFWVVGLQTGFGAAGIYFVINAIIVGVGAHWHDHKTYACSQYIGVRWTQLAVRLKYV
jgi:hypothetical protein